MDGAVLKEWRRSRGWDAPELARRLRKAAGSSAVPEPDSLKRMIWRWERKGLRNERYELLYAKALGVSPDDLAIGPAEPEVSSLPPVLGSEDGDDPVRRREFGVAAAMSAMSLLDVMRGHSAELPERVADGSRVDEEAAAGLANVVLGYRQIYQSAGAGAPE